MIIISLILITVFLINFTVFWTIQIKILNKKDKILSAYKKIFPLICVICLNPIPFISSSFLEPYFNDNVSYFRQYWIWFLMLGVIFSAVGVKIYTLIKKSVKDIQEDEEDYRLVTNGVYKIIRHPTCLAWLLLFIGSTFILDSFVGLVITPLLIIITNLYGFLKEKYVFVPRFGILYETYKEKTPYRVISPPYNSLLMIIAIFVILIGFYNLEYIF